MIMKLEDIKMLRWDITDNKLKYIDSMTKQNDKVVILMDDLNKMIIRRT